MDETTDLNQNENGFDPEDEDYELTHTDKLVGVFTEPGTVFSNRSQEGPKTADWVIPVILVVIIASLANFILMSNPKIKYDIQEKQIEKIQKGMDEAVSNGDMTQEQADERMEMIQSSMEKQMGAGQIFAVVGIVIATFVGFFIVSGFFFALSKFALKGDGTYASAMSAWGLPYYIAIIQTVVMVIIALSMDKFMTGTSVGEIMGFDKSELPGFLMSKLDLFSIWFYYVVGTGLAKMFKSENSGKYLALVFGSWLGFSLLFFFLAKSVPALGFLNM